MNRVKCRHFSAYHHHYHQQLLYSANLQDPVVIATIVGSSIGSFILALVYVFFYYIKRNKHRQRQKKKFLRLEVMETIILKIFKDEDKEYHRYLKYQSFIIMFIIIGKYQFHC